MVVRGRHELRSLPPWCDAALEASSSARERGTGTLEAGFSILESLLTQANWSGSAPPQKRVGSSISIDDGAHREGDRVGCRRTRDAVFNAADDGTDQHLHERQELTLLLLHVKSCGGGLQHWSVTLAVLVHNLNRSAENGCANVLDASDRPDPDQSGHRDCRRQLWHWPCFWRAQKWPRGRPAPRLPRHGQVRSRQAERRARELSTSSTWPTSTASSPLPTACAPRRAASTLSCSTPAS